MNVSKRFMVLFALILLIGALKEITVRDTFSKVEAFRGAQLENSVFYPLIARSINNEGLLTASFDESAVHLTPGELLVGDDMEIMASLPFIRDVLFCSAREGEDGSVLLERSGRMLSMVSNFGYVPLRQVCDEFGFSYHFNASNSKLKITSTEESAFTLPANFDLRDRKRVPALRDQGNSSTCWAYAAVGAMESSLLPEEHASFSPDEMVAGRPFSRVGTDGGDFAMALANVLSWKGPVNMDPSAEKKRVTEVHMYSEDDIDDIKKAVFLYGGVSTSLFADIEDGPLNESEYYSVENNAYCYRGSNDPNHDVIIIGWNDSYPASDFKNYVPGDGAFICQNSWGSSFGEAGVFYVSYYDTHIGNQTVSYAKLKSASTDERIFQYDACGWTGQIGYEKENAWGAAIYEADEDVDITSAGFYVLGRDSKYQLYFVENCKDPKDLANRVRVADGTLTDSGFYTIDFNTPYSVKKGDSFAVILYISTPDSEHPLAIEMQASSIVEGDVDISDGRTYSSTNGLSWDSIEEGAEGNLCLKAYGLIREDDTDAKED